MLASVDGSRRFNAGRPDGWLVVLIGTRGYPLGEHARIGGVDARLYCEQLHVPWIIRFPSGLGRLGRSGALTSHVDLLPTILGWLDDSNASPLEGVDGINVLLRVRTARAEWRETLLAASATSRAIRTPAWCLRQDVPFGSSPPETVTDGGCRRIVRSSGRPLGSKRRGEIMPGRRRDVVADNGRCLAARAAKRANSDSFGANCPRSDLGCIRSLLLAAKALSLARTGECKLIWLQWRDLPRIRRLLLRRNSLWEQRLELIHGRPRTGRHSHSLCHQQPMIGQGSPSSTALASARAGRFWIAAARALGWRFAPMAAIVLSLWLAPAVRPQESASVQPAAVETELFDSGHQDDPIRIRITWGGGQASQWRGQMGLDDGSLADLRIAGLNADSSGSVWLENGRLHVASLSPRQVEGIEISVRGPKESKLLVDLSADPDEPPLRAQVVLSDALRTGVLLKLDERGNTLKVESAPGNALNLRTDGRPLIFFPGEQFSFELNPALVEAVPGTTLDIETSLTPAGNREILWQADERLAVPIEGPTRMVLTVPLPQAEGVYEVRVVASRPPGFGKRFLPGASTLLAEQRFQVVVLEGHSGSTAETAEWESVLEIDPTSPRWWDRLPTWTQLRRVPVPGLKQGPLGSIRAGAIEHPLGRFVELPPPAQGGECHWQAYSLPLEAVDVPHLLEIEYPADKEQQLGISIVEPNSAGIVDGIGRDSGCYVEGLGRSTTHERTTHRVVFWPRTQAPLLLLTNQHPSTPAHFGHIRVLKRSGPQLASSTNREASHDRWVAAYISRPHLAETFGATHKRSAASAFDSPFDASGDDWQTHYQATTRLADYLHYAGYNSAVINVFGEAHSLYRSNLLLPKAENDSNRPQPAMFEADGLELMLRVFDREQLALVPSVRFAAPLPELEELRRGNDPQTSGLEWIGPDGRTWVETYGARDGLAPYYNLLDPRVQHAMLSVVSELVDRYGHHPSLAGIAVQLSTNSYAQLPPLEWGLDDATVSRFEREAGVQVAAAGPNRFAARHASIVREHAEACALARCAGHRVLSAIGRGNTRRRRAAAARAHDRGVARSCPMVGPHSPQHPRRQPRFRRATRCGHPA